MSGKIIVSLVIALIALFANAWLPYQTFTSLSYHSDAQEHAIQSLDALDILLLHTVELENHKRGYIITGDESYRQRYADTVLTQRMAFTSLQNLVEKTDKQRLMLLSKLEHTMDRQAIISQETMARRRDQGLHAIALLMQGDESKRLIQSVVTETRHYRELEMENLRQLRNLDGMNIHKAKMLLIGLTVSDILLFGFVFWYMSATLRANRSINSLLTKNSEQLEHALVNAKVMTKELQASHDALMLSEEQFRKSFTTAAIGMALVGPDGSWLKVNEALCKMLGMNEAYLLSRTFQHITHPDDLELDLELLTSLINGERDHYRMDKRYFHHDGHIIWVTLSVSIVRDAQQRPVHFVSQIEDITDRKQHQEEMERMAFFDPLTSLPNRRLIMDRLDQAVLRAERYQQTIALMFIDIDHFKWINDTYGHDIGDELLQYVGDTVNKSIRRTDTLGRQGGDEFVLILGEIDHPDTALRIASNIHQSFNTLVHLHDQSLQITLSLGIAIRNPVDNLNSQNLMKQADIALYEVKAAGRNGYKLYQASMASRPAQTK